MCENSQNTYGTCSHIWHVIISKYVYWLDTQSVKVWWSYVLPNTNAVNFCDIFRHKSVFSTRVTHLDRQNSNVQNHRHTFFVFSLKFLLLFSSFSNSKPPILYKTTPTTPKSMLQWKKLFKFQLKLFIIANEKKWIIN